MVGFPLIVISCGSCETLQKIPRKNHRLVTCWWPQLINCCYWPLKRTPFVWGLLHHLRNRASSSYIGNEWIYLVGLIHRPPPLPASISINTKDDKLRGWRWSVCAVIKDARANSYWNRSRVDYLHCNWDLSEIEGEYGRINVPPI